MSKRTCSGVRPDGSPCSATPTASGLCFAHDPKLRQKTAEGRRAGGHNRSNASRARKAMGREVRDIVQIVEAAMGGVLQSRITPPQAQAVASLAGAWVKLHEHGELEARLQALEERAQAAGNRRGW